MQNYNNKTYLRQNNIIFVKNTLVMKKSKYTLILFLIALTTISCGDKKDPQAIQYLDNIRSLYEKGEYEIALQQIDSIQTLFPKAFQEIKDALALKQDVRRASDEKQITNCDSLIATYQPKIDSIKKLFIYRKEKEDDYGVYIPKTISGNTPNATTLRSGVNDNGSMYIESVYIGGQIHNSIKVNTKDGKFAETLPIEGDGFVFRFNHMGKQYEIVQATSVHDNGLANFIFAYADRPLTVTLKGKNTTSFALPNIQKKAIADSYQLSRLMLQKDSLATAKDKAQMRIKYLNAKRDSIPVVLPNSLQEKK